MKKLFVTSVIGAPTKTAVAIIDNNLNELDWKQESFEIYNFLKLKKISFSKIAFIFRKSDFRYDFKFVQIKFIDENIELESNANCGNSMISAGRVIFMLLEKNNISSKKINIKNIDTDLEILLSKKDDSFDIFFNSLIGKSISNIKIFEGSESIQLIEEYGTINVSLIDIVNPYIIVNAKDVGISTDEELLSLNSYDNNIIYKVNKIRNDVVKKYKFNEKSEFPKIAVVLNKEKLVARTIYLNNWHSGLPLTAIISILATCKLKNSVIYENEKDITEIITAKGIKPIKLVIDKNGIISNCAIFDIKSNGNIDEFHI